MNTPSVTTFKLSRKKQRGLFLTTLFSALIGIGSLTLSHELKLGEGRFLLLLVGFFLLSTTVFCCISYYYLTREKFTAIYISEEGVNDISTGNRFGTILWKEVENIKVMDDISNLKRKYIVLKVKNPNEYIDREPARSKKRSMELRLQYYGSPICISNRALDCTFEELKQAVFERYNLYKASHEEA